MGNCLGLCEIFGSSPERSTLLRASCTFQPSVANFVGRSARGQNCNINSRCRRASLATEEPITVLDETTDDVKLHYDLREELGRGQFGVIRFCTNKHTGENFACKSIAKGRLCRQKDVDDVRREIQIMRQLVGHPNIVELKDVYEDETWVHLVMELCEGGELYDSIVHKKAFSEKEAAAACKTLMEALLYCHNHGVIHRDLKPENILLAHKNDPTTDLKLADFGLAVKFLPGEKLGGIAGSAYYIAPEVLKGEYGEEVDVWSAGVILYILLSGVPPFWGDTEGAIFDAIRFGLLDLSSHPWPSISPSAKDLIKGMLSKDIKKRLTPDQVLNHRWIVEHTQTADLPILPASVPVDIHSNSRSWCSETTSCGAASLYTVSEVRSNREAYAASPTDGHIQHVSSFRANSLIQSLTSHECMISASMPESRCMADEGEAEQAMLQHCSLPEISKINSLELRSCILNSSSNAQPRSKKSHTPIISSLQDLAFPCTDTVLLQKHCSCTLLEENGLQRTIVVNTCKGKFLVVHDLQHMRIGRKRLGEREAITAAASDQLNKLYWPPYSCADHAHTQHRQLVC